MTRVILFASAVLSGMEASAEVVLTGKLGPYAIEAELHRDDAETLAGRYRYAGKEAWLSLSGQSYGQEVIFLTERSGHEETGSFFLNVASQGLQGVWVADETEHAVALTIQSGTVRGLLPPPPVEEVSESLTGRYSTGAYWINDWFAPRYEVGFNGGDVNVVQIDADRLLVHFNFVVGPTYHIASFQGLALRSAENVFEVKRVLEGGQDECHLTFGFSQDGLSVSDQGTGWACQFGARAHANFDLQKVSDRAEFRDAW